MLSEEDIKCIEDNIKQSKRLFEEVGVYAYFDTVEKLLQGYKELKNERQLLNEKYVDNIPEGQFIGINKLQYKEYLELRQNSIPKSVIEEMIEEIDEEYNKMNTPDNNEWYIDSEKFAYAKEKIEELLKGDK